MNFPQATPDEVEVVSQRTRFGICAFVDVFGFSDRVLFASGVADIANIRTALQRAREQFEFNPNDQMTKDTHAMYEKRVLAASDSIVTFVPVDSRAAQYNGDFDTIFSELTPFASAQGWLVVHEGVFTRGAVDLGWWFEEPDTVISDALVRAYRLETQANIPVIALGADLHNFLVNHETRQTYADVIEPVARHLRRHDQVVRSRHGERQWSFYYLDYIRICLGDLNWERDAGDHLRYRETTSDVARQRMMDEGYIANVHDWLRLHAERIRDGHAMAPDSARGNYEWLADYHNEVAAGYAPDGSLDCIL